MTQSITTENDVKTAFSSEITSTLYTKLPSLSCFEVSGEDAQDFLQGQFTNDVQAVNAIQGQLNSYCTPKGRMLAIFYLCQWQDKFYLVLSSDIAAATMQRIQMFVMRAKVTITDCSDHLHLHALFGEQSGRTLEVLNIKAPEQSYQTSATDNGVCLNIPGVVPRYLLIANEELSLQLDQLDDTDSKSSTPEHWQWLDIMSGLPSLTSATQESFVPQMANLELIDGVSFSKGCYPGQEVVARLHYLGNANRRMYRLQISSNDGVNPGDDVYHADDEKEQAIGEVVSAVVSGTDETSALAVLRVEAAEKNNLAIGSTTGPRAEVMSLPYEIPPPEKNKKADL